MMLCIQADGNEIIGQGHIMRCLAFAHAVHNELLLKPIFLTRYKQSHELIKSNDFESYYMGINPEDDSLVTNVIRDKAIKIMVIDNFLIKGKFLKRLSSLVDYTAYFDDVFSLDFPTDIIINYNPNWEKGNYEHKFPNSKLLTGTNFAPLRKQFQNLKLKPPSRNVKNVLITTGGTNPSNIVQKIVNNLSRTTCFKDIIFHVAIGSFYHDKEELKSYLSLFSNIKIYENCDIYSLLQNCDIALSAAGTTIFEIAASSIPSIVFSVSANQYESAEYFNKMKCVLYAGKDFDSIPDNVVDCFLKLYGDFDLRSDLCKNANSISDGKGAIYLAQELKKFLNGRGCF
jgi:UDP-2,4-diacetamido-2,4,6-trideoxy-beta-L-altropyranose hydrolase